MRHSESFQTGNPALDREITTLLEGPGSNLEGRLLAEMLASIVKFGRDGMNPLDLKIVNAALKELRQAFRVFQPYRDIRKVAVFGSTRLDRRERLYRMAVEFGRLMAEAGWMVITGGASGIMRAGHEGAGRRASFGLNIRLPFEQAANPIIAGDPKLLTFKYFFTRKLLFIKESQATILFPGGLGTLDEGFECLTLVQTGKTEPRPIVLIDEPGARYWKRFLQFFEVQLVRRGMVSEEDRSLFTLVTSPEAAREELMKFYATYHSLRYVGNHLVIRLTAPLDSAQVARLSRQFRDILSTGEIVARGPLPVEVKERDHVELPRLVLHFNQQDFGRLRQLIDRINELGERPGPGEAANP